jgi:hypothetical protein
MKHSTFASAARAATYCALFTALLGFAAAARASECDTISVATGTVIWCDSFEDEDLPPSGRLADNYFNYTDHTGGQKQGRSTNESYDGNYSLRHSWNVGDVSLGWFFRTFGRSPVSTQSHSTTDFREVYWRVYAKYPIGTTAFPNKFSRATVFAGSNWSQAMIAHLWKSNNTSFLKIDPASGTDAAGNVMTTSSNDTANLRWLGAVTASDPIVPGQWQCFEAHVKLNTAGASDGVFQLWIDGNLVASRNNLNWVGAYNGYGINAIQLESYWNGGATEAVERYMDAFVIATGRIGCNASVRPSPPTNLGAN